MQVKNIIFDFGAVLFNLDFGRTSAAFAALVGDRTLQRSLYQRLSEEHFLERFEIGAVSELEFIQKMQSLSPYPLHSAQICTAWSAMLLDLPAERLELLKKIKAAGYKIFLLSNINVVHLRDTLQHIEQELGLSQQEFESLFDKVYYSHLIGHRKPELATYDWVLQDAGLLASETVFIDDNHSNIEGAKAAGWGVYLHPANGNLQKTLENLQIL